MAHIGHPMLGDTLYPIPEHVLLARDADVICAGPTDTLFFPAVPTAPTAAGAPAAQSAPANPPATSPPLLSAGFKLDTETHFKPGRVDSCYPRLCLHALHLRFTHPTTKQPMVISATPPGSASTSIPL
jgi:hypothetical protein